MLFKKKVILKTSHVRLRVTEAEKAQLKERADANKMTISEYLLRTGLNRPIVKSNTTAIVLELLNLSRQQKILFANDKSNKAHYLAILIAIVDALKSIPHRVNAGKG